MSVINKSPSSTTRVGFPYLIIVPITWSNAQSINMANEESKMELQVHEGPLVAQIN